MTDDRQAAVSVLGEAVLLGDDTPQSEALGEAVAEHIAARPATPRPPLDPAVLEAFDTLRAKAAEGELSP